MDRWALGSCLQAQHKDPDCIKAPAASPVTSYFTEQLRLLFLRTIMQQLRLSRHAGHRWYHNPHQAAFHGWGPTQLMVAHFSSVNGRKLYYMIRLVYIQCIQ